MVFQILSMISFGLSNCFWYKPLVDISSLRLIVLRSSLTSICFLLLVFLTELNVINLPLNHVVIFHNLNYLDVLKSIGLCFINYWGLFFFLKSMQHTDARISISISSAGTLIWFLMGIYLYNEKPALSSYIYILIFTLGWWFIENLSKKAWQLKWSKGVTYALLCMLFWRSGGLFAMVIPKIGVLYFSLILEVTVFVISSVLLFFTKNSSISFFQDVRKHKYNLLALVIFGFVGVLLFNVAISGTTLYTFALIGMLQPLTSIIIGSFIFKTRLSLYQKIGITILMTGMSLQMLNIF